MHSTPTDKFASNACDLPGWRVFQVRLVTGRTLSDSVPRKLVTEIVFQHGYVPSKIVQCEAMRASLHQFTDIFFGVHRFCLLDAFQRQWIIYTRHARTSEILERGSYVGPRWPKRTSTRCVTTWTKKRIVNFCTRAVASIHARLVCSGGDPLATSDPVLTDHFAWAIKVSSVTHSGPSDSGACTARPSCSRPGKCGTGTARPRCGSVTERAPASGSARCDFWASRCVTVARFAERACKCKRLHQQGIFHQRAAFC